MAEDILGGPSDTLGEVDTSTFELIARKGVASGYAGLDSTGYVPSTQLIPNIINVKDPLYGAVGDGITDDRPAIQAALTAAAGNGILYFPPGIYLLNTTGPLSIIRSGIQDVQTITTTGTPDGGSFTLTFGGATTAAIVYNASASAIASALNLLTPVIKAGGVQASGGSLPTGVVVRFNALGAQALLTSTDSLTGGTTPTTAIAHTTIGTGTATNSLRIMGAGAGATTVKLSTTCKRAFDMRRVADFDVFQNLEVCDMTVDANNVASATNQHVVLGNLIDGNWDRRLNFANIAVRRVRSINVPAAAGDGSTQGARQNVSLNSLHLASSEATQTYVKDILVEDCDFRGGGFGIVAAGGGGSAGLGANVWVDNINIVRSKHDTLTIPSVSAIHANIQIGGAGFGGDCNITEFYGANSFDVGIEIDGMQNPRVSNTTIVDAWNAHYFVRNFRAPLHLQAQHAVCRDCLARNVNLDPGVSGTTHHYSIGGDTSTAGYIFGHLSLVNCTSSFETRFADVGSTVGLSVGAGAGCQFHGITLRDFKVGANALNVAPASARTTAFIDIQSALATGSICNLDGISFHFAGVRGNSTVMTWKMLRINGTEVVLASDKVNVDWNVTGGTAASDSVLHHELGADGSACLLRGYINRPTVTRMVTSSFTGIHTGSNLTIGGTNGGLLTQGLLYVTNMDFSRATRNQGFDISTASFVNQVVVKNVIGTRAASSPGVSVASATALTLPQANEVITVTGTTTITSITASWPDRRVTLIFSGILTLTDGSNLKLNGNITTAADTTVSLICDGTNWYETGWSAN